MSVASQTRPQTKMYTPEDLLDHPDGDHYELVDGQFVEKTMSMLTGGIESLLIFLLVHFCREHDLGSVLTASCGFQCFPRDPNRVRRPDVSFIRKARITADVSPDGFAKIPPDLAVEVVSPRDLASDLDEKLDDYRSASIPLIWVIYPVTRKGWIYRADGSVSLIREDGELSGEDVLPGFRCPLRSILPAVSERKLPVEPESDNGAGKPGGSRSRSKRRKP
ncbi:Uma2 family endonuclease [Aquisphaera insulae]|uniref:Uma2 family endonuclease n=1 Tax=Aquisphaera insulae TaxID=2712864 RepID=UPI0013EC3A6E|nr:Uma2 family endonuclease [Aquisphaera insulae]